MMGAFTPLAARLLASAALLAAVSFAALDWRDARADRAALKVCVSAAGSADKPIEGCPLPVAQAIVDARQAAACAAAIEAGDLFGERTSCAAPVKRRGAELAAARADLADVQAQLADAERLSLAAISRAEARATTAAQRSAHAAATLAKAPRAHDGFIGCDADCLRGLSGPSAESR